MSEAAGRPAAGGGDGADRGLPASASVKHFLTLVGRRCPERIIGLLDTSVDSLEVGRWMRSHGYSTHRRVHRREQVFDRIAETVAGEEVLYLEFGVAQGRSMRYWSRLLRDPSAKLHGFDTFEGLPERWRYGNPAGAYSAGGAVPSMDDHRVSFFKGLFEDTLATYTAPPHDRLVANFDADLYSSTSVALAGIQHLVEPGSFLYFDEFNDRNHEMKAFEEFLASTSMEFLLFSCDRTLTHVAFQRIA